MGPGCCLQVEEPVPWCKECAGVQVNHLELEQETPCPRISIRIHENGAPELDRAFPPLDVTIALDWNFQTRNY